MNFKPYLLALAGITGLASVGSAHAEFSGAYAPQNWAVSNSNGGNGTELANSVSMILLSSNFTDFESAPIGASTLNASITVLEDTTLSFQWAYGTADDNGSSQDTFGYAINGVATKLSADGSYDPQAGMASLQVLAGQTFSFQMVSQDSLFGAATATITEFNAISSVPEPSALALMGVGLLSAGWSQRRRR